MSISRDEVRHIAKLARLQFDADDEQRLADSMGRILDYMNKLNELDTTGVPPMSHVLDVTNVFREDAVDERIDRDQALQNAPDADEEYIRVPKVID